MTYFYAKKIPLCILSFLLLSLGTRTALQAQQKANPAAHAFKIADSNPLHKIGPELAALQVESNVGKMQARSQLQAKPLSRKSLIQVQGGYVVIEAMAEENKTEQLKADLTSLGMVKAAAYKHMVSGLLPIQALDEAAALPNMRFARPAYKPMHRIGAVTSQGDLVMYADSARKQQAVNGKNSKIGVLSDSYNILEGAEAGVKSGDLPGKNNPNGFTTPVQVLLDDDYPDNTDEGRAMLEIIHDVAPGAELAFHTASLGQASFAQGILNLQKAGCNIITDDIIYPAEPMFQDGIIAQAIDEVVKKNTSFFSAAGNNARQSYQAEFKNSGQSVVVNGVNYGVAHDFGKGDITQKIRIPGNGLLFIPLQWDDPYFSVSGLPGAQTDLDVLVFYEGELLPYLSSFEKNTGNDPLEFVGISTGSDEVVEIEIVIVKHSGPDPKLIKWVNFGDAYPLEHITNSSTIYGHSNAVGAISTGAVAFFDTPAYGNLAPVAEPYSSAGGTPILFDANGNRKAAEIRQKPEIMAPDFVATSFFFYLINDTYYFPGTSAAAPHAAAVAALMQEHAGNNMSPNQIKENLQQTALDMNEPGFDFDTGYGFINAFDAIKAVAKPKIQSFNLVNANNGKRIQTIQEGAIINLTRLPSQQVRIQVTTTLAEAGSVVFTMNNDQVIENLAPYDYPGSLNKFLTLQEGFYTLTATPYTKPNGKGESGIPLTIHFSVVKENIERFELIDVATGKVIKELQDNDQLNLTTLPAKLNIRAIAEPKVTGSIQFNLNGVLVTENQSYYEVAGSSGNAINFAPGEFTLTATVYPKSRARGKAGASRTVKFQVTDDLADQDIASARKEIQYIAYPNPATQYVKIKFSVPETEDVTLAIYDLKGTPVKVFHTGKAEAGKQYEYVLDGTTLQSGLYISQLITKKGIRSETLKLNK